MYCTVTLKYWMHISCQAQDRYRELNSVTKLDGYPLPHLDDTLDQLQGAEYFNS